MPTHAATSSEPERQQQQTDGLAFSGHFFSHWLLGGLDSIAPVSRLATLMRDGKDLRPAERIFFVYDRKRETIEVVDAQTIFIVWATLLIFDNQVAYALVFSKEGCGNHAAGMLGVVHGRITKLSLCFGVNRVAHATLALTRAKASSPGTIATLPLRTSSRRRKARLSQALCALDLGSKLAINNSRIRARSSAGRSRTSAARSWTGVVMVPPVR